MDTSAFELPESEHTAIQNAANQALAHQQKPLTATEQDLLRAKIKRLLTAQNAVLVAHYYTDASVQILAEETGGCVADSLEMARFGNDHPAQTLIVAGVKFMGETAKILNPEKRILMPDITADCSLDLGCPIASFSEFCDQYPDHLVVVYSNTSVEVKARSDWVVTSGSALAIVKMLAASGKKILWAPDRHLGAYIQTETGVDMVIWPGSCIVHEAFKADSLRALKQKYPEAKILVHPESPADVVQMADVVGSTTALINAVKVEQTNLFIVATDRGIFHKMKQVAPHKTFLEAPTRGDGATCESCAHCPWMSLNSLTSLANVLETGANEIVLDETLRKQAFVPIKRLLDFAKEQKNGMQGKDKS